MHIFLFLFTAALTRAAPPAVVGSGWRHVTFNVNNQPIGMTLFVVTFDQDLYVNISGNLSLLANFRRSIGEWPEIAYRLQGSLGVTCGGATANKYNFPDGVPDYILAIPPTEDPMTTFFGYFAGFFLDANKVNNRLAFAVLDAQPPFLNSGITKAQMDACLSNGTLQIELFPATCLPSQTLINTINGNYPNSNPYQASDLFCAVSNAAGENIPTQSFFVPSTPFIPDCNLRDIKQMQADVIKLKEFTKTGVNSRNDLNGIDFAEIAIQTRLAYQGCLSITQQVLQMETFQKYIGDSAECPDRRNSSSPAYLSDPCCNHQEGVCCVPKPVTANFQAPRSVNISKILGICPSAQNDSQAISSLLVRFAINLNKEADAPPREDINVVFSNFFDNVWSECRTSLNNQFCSTNAECYSRKCDTNSGQCSNDPNGDALPMIRCLIEKYNGGSGTIAAAFADFANVNPNLLLTDPETVPELIYRKLLMTDSGTDCVGRNAWNFRAQLRDLRNPDTGAWEQTFISANASGCTAERTCNWNSYSRYTEAECASRGLSEFFCGICGQGNQCQDITEVPICRFNWNFDFTITNQTQCQAIQGFWSYENRHSTRQVCLRQRINDTIAQGLSGCLDQTICPGPNSPSQWIRDLFTMPQYDNYACSNEICYDAQLNQTECMALRQTLSANYASCTSMAGVDPIQQAACVPWNIYWDADYRDGAGLCVRNLFTNQAPQQNAQICSAIAGASFNYYAGAVYRYGKFATQAECTGGIACSLPNKQPFSVATEAECTSQAACDFSCPACVQTTAAENTLFCSTPLNQTACSERKQGNPQWDSLSMTCLVEVADSAACSALSGTMASCRDYSQSQCGNFSLPYQSVLSCRFRDYAPCLNQTDCGMQGECDDWDLSNWENCFQRGGCNICVYPFPKDAMNRTITRCGIPIVDGYPCEKCGVPTYSDYRWSRFGCILNNQTNTANQSMCEASTAPYDSSLSGMWMGRAKTESECINRATGCLRFGGWRLRTDPASCAGCGGQNSSLYTWRSGQFRSGSVVALSWRRRQFQPINSIVPTLPLARVEQTLQKVVARFIGGLEANRIVRSYDFRFSIYEQMIRRCNNASYVLAASGGITGTCKCYGGGKPCEGFCPVECVDPCEYDAIGYIAGQLTGGVRRRLTTSLTTSTEVVRDALGNLVGAFIGDALQLNGTLSGIQFVCLPDNVQYVGNISSAYTVYDFAPAVPPDNSPGVPLNIPATRQGTSTCGNLTIGNTAYYPILRLPNFATGFPTTANPSVTPTTSFPSTTPSMSPSNGPTGSPATSQPSMSPTMNPSSNPSVTPSMNPSTTPSMNPSMNPSTTPSRNPSMTPSKSPSNMPSTGPSSSPSMTPSSSPSKHPSTTPSKAPTSQPSTTPSQNPSTTPSSGPTMNPSKTPSSSPSKSPSMGPTLSVSPTKMPSMSPSRSPTGSPIQTCGCPSTLPAGQMCSAYSCQYRLSSAMTNYPAISSATCTSNGAQGCQCPTSVMDTSVYPAVSVAVTPVPCLCCGITSRQQCIQMTCPTTGYNGAATTANCEWASGACNCPRNDCSSATIVGTTVGFLNNTYSASISIPITCQNAAATFCSTPLSYALRVTQFNVTGNFLVETASCTMSGTSFSFNTVLQVQTAAQFTELQGFATSLSATDGWLQSTYGFANTSCTAGAINCTNLGGSSVCGLINVVPSSALRVSVSAVMAVVLGFFVLFS